MYRNAEWERLALGPVFSEFKPFESLSVPARSFFDHRIRTVRYDGYQAWGSAIKGDSLFGL
jgi:hypothetical protein